MCRHVEMSLLVLFLLITCVLAAVLQARKVRGMRNRSLVLEHSRRPVHFIEGVVFLSSAHVIKEH